MAAFSFDKLKKRYLNAIILIFFVGLISQIFVQYTILKQSSDAETINIAGRQRMLSQKIVRMAHYLALEPESKDETLAQIDSLFEQFTFSHDHLREQSQSSKISTKIRSEFMDGFNHLDPIVSQYESFIEKLKSQERPNDELLRSGHDLAKNFLAGMEVLVFKFEQLAAGQVRQLQWIEALLFLLFALILVYEVVFVIFPAQNLYSKQNRLLQEEKVISFHKSRLATIGEVGASLAHEINNPLAIITSYCEALRVQLDGKEQNQKSMEAVGGIEHAVDRVSGITRTLLKLARGDSSRAENIDLESLLQASLQFAKISIIDKQIKVEVVNHLDSAPLVNFNAGQLLQVLTNLIKNAVESMAASDKKLLRFEISENKGKIQLSVIDSGPGLPSDIHDKIFDNFFTTKDEGTGIGLALVQKIMLENRGEVILDNKYREGAKFDLTFPCVVA